MRKLAKIMSVAVLAGAFTAAPALAQQQTQAQPFQPYNGSNGAGPLNPAAGNGWQNPRAPMRLYGIPNVRTYNGGNTNPACDRNSRAYNPSQCR